jgi:osomolarity two-component system sensor histidine kinase SLN1
VTSPQGFPGGQDAVPQDAQPRLVGLSAPFFAAGKTKEGAAAEPDKLSGRKLRILIAEDNKTNQIVLLKMLRIEKIFNVDVAEDGKEALELVKISMEEKSEYNLVFMDVQMPNMDGLEATRLIREAGFTRPIVALSAYSDDTNIKACKAAGEISCLNVAFDMLILFAQEHRTSSRSPSSSRAYASSCRPTARTRSP